VHTIEEIRIFFTQRRPKVQIPSATEAQCFIATRSGKKRAWRGSGRRRSISIALGLSLGFTSGLSQLGWTAAAADNTGPAAGAQQAPKLMPLTPKPSPAPAIGSGKAPAAASAGPGSWTQPGPQPQGTSEDKYPLIGQLEQITFGFAKAQTPIDERLTLLEKTIYHQSYPQLSLFDRSQRLKDTLLGPRVDPDVPPPQSQRPARTAPAPEMHTATIPPKDLYDQIESLPPGQSLARPPRQPPPEYLWSQPEFQQARSHEELEKYALELVNQERGQLGLAALEWDDLAARVAKEHVDDLARRNTNSYLAASGSNPDRRYTEAGGNDAISEHLVAMGTDMVPAENKALVARSMYILKGRQDDRDALLSPDATHFGYSFERTYDKQHMLTCSEVIVKHGMMHPIPQHVAVGDKINVKGVILQPYAFQKMTIAWEGLPDKQPAESNAISDEAMPYFPPLDFVAYAHKSEKDWEKTKTILRTLGVMAAIAGGMFMPPVALAAPLIAVAGTGTGDLKAAPDIPVKGGIKVEGSLFHGEIPVDHLGKTGLYYLTVWAAGPDGKLVPVSRRTIIADGSQAEATAQQPGAPENAKVQDKSEVKEQIKE